MNILGKMPEAPPLPTWTRNATGYSWFARRGSRSGAIHDIARHVSGIEHPTKQAREAEAERLLDIFLEQCPEASQEYPEKP